MPSWYLEDADPIAAEYKYTFYKPSRELIAQVQAGECVKLIFRFDSEDPQAPGAERMWVKVESVAEDGRFHGRLDNEPRYIQDLKADDPVDFAACHIIATQHDDDDNLVQKYIGRCFVTQRILSDGARVGYLYREEPDEEGDSGWRFSANDESDEYMDTAGNIAYVSIGAVLSRDDSFLHLLDLPSDCAFVRDPATGEFVAAEGDE
jgi:hypothetical protein